MTTHTNPAVSSRTVLSLLYRDHSWASAKWISTDMNSADLFTKNLPGPAFEKHVDVYCGTDEYKERVDSQGEGVSVTGIESRGSKVTG
jgi:hypothetical protein